MKIANIAPVAKSVVSQTRLPISRTDNLNSMSMTALFQKGVQVMDSIRKSMYPRGCRVAHRIESPALPIPQTPGLFFRMGFYHFDGQYGEKTNYPTLYAKYVKPILSDSDRLFCDDWDFDHSERFWYNTVRMARGEKPIIPKKGGYYYVGDSFVTGSKRKNDIYRIGHQLSGRLWGEVSAEGIGASAKNLDDKRLEWDKNPFRTCLKTFLNEMKAGNIKKSDFKEVYIQDGFYS